MRKLWAIVIALAILAVLAAVIGIVVFWIPGKVIEVCLMTLAGLLAFGMVWGCVYEELGTRKIW